MNDRTTEATGHKPRVPGRKPHAKELEQNLPLVGISVAETARILGCSEGTIWHRLRDGTLQSFMFGDLRKIDFAHLMEHVVGKVAPVGPSRNPEGRYPTKSKKVKEPAE
jgi:excisionase family DNA binding protein